MILVSEQVGRGHPDKVCDQVSDLFVDYCLSKNPRAKVAVETTLGKTKMFITGELSGVDFGSNFQSLNIKDDIEKLLVSIDPRYKDIEIELDLSIQSEEILKQVDFNSDEKIGAGDQGLMFGYATNETEEMLSIPYVLANKLIAKYEQDLVDLDNYFYDSKSQVAFDYETNTIKNIVLSVQHSDKVSLETLRETIRTKVIDKAIPNQYIDENTEYYINHYGTFVKGGSFADAGTTGRKIVADTYGGASKVGGGAFSGKDPSKVDRSAAYYARYVAKNIVMHGLASECEIGVGYVIGGKQELALNIDCFGTEMYDLEVIEGWVKNNFDFSVDNIIKELSLQDVNCVKYSNTTIGGHFGKSNLPWERKKTDCQRFMWHGISYRFVQDQGANYARK